MAKTVSYFQDSDEEMYSEGPYVLCAGPLGQGYRVEVKGSTSPIMAPLWTFYLREARGIPIGWQPYEVLAPFVDDLNALHKALHFGG